MSANHGAVTTDAVFFITSSYYTIIASTAYACTKMVLCNNSAIPIAVALGASGSEVDLVAVQANGQTTVDMGLNQCPAGTRVSAYAPAQTTFSGYLTVSLLP